MDWEDNEFSNLSADDWVETRETAHGQLFRRADNILVFRPFDGPTAPDVGQLEEDFDMMTKMLGDTRVPLLSFIRATPTLNPAAKRIVQQKLPQVSTAYAMVANSPLARFNISVFLYMYRPNIPTKVFRTANAALLWLKSHSK